MKIHGYTLALIYQQPEKKLQAMETYVVVRYRGSYIFYTVDPQHLSAYCVLNYVSN
jgi:hypothetical protein